MDHIFTQSVKKYYAHKECNMSTQFKKFQKIDISITMQLTDLPFLVNFKSNYTKILMEVPDGFFEVIHQLYLVLTLINNFNVFLLSSKMTKKYT